MKGWFEILNIFVALIFSLQQFSGWKLSFIRIDNFRRVRFSPEYEIDISTVPEEWGDIREVAFNGYIYSLEEIKQVLRNLLRDHSFVSSLVKRLWPDDNVTIDKISKLKVALFQQGWYYGVFRIEINTKNGESRFFGINVPKTPQANSMILDDYKNLQILYRQEASYVITPYSLNKVSDVLKESELNIFSFAWYPSYKEINNYDSERLYINSPPSIDIKENIIDRSDSNFIKIQMIKILTIYYILTKKAVGYYYTEGDGSWERGVGAYLEAGDFIFKTSPNGEIKLRLVTVRTLLDIDIAQFIHGLFIHKERINRSPISEPKIIFTLEQVIQGIISGLKEVYGKEKGRKQAVQWLRKYQEAVQGGTVSDNSFLVIVEKFLTDIRES